MADGYARLTGRPQAVIVHVDVGTQALGQAFHNASSGHVPVFVFAGMTPFTQDGELRGSRNEFINWYQDIPDQKAICSQYCRYTAEVHTGRNIKQMVARAVQFATSRPQGPVYLCAAREVLEEEIEPYSIDQAHWEPIDLGALPPKAVKEIAKALLQAEAPLLITGYTGRNHATPAYLMKLADAVPALRVFDAGMTDMSFPQSHPACITPLAGARSAIAQSDVILILDSDVPWVPASVKPRPDARIFHVDPDPLKSDMLLFYIPASARYKAASEHALLQLSTEIESSTHEQTVDADTAKASSVERANAHAKQLEAVALRGQPPESSGTPPSVGYLCAQLREICPENTIWVSEAVTNHIAMQDQLRAELPGTFITKGGAGLGWNGGGSLGVKLAAEDLFSEREKSATNMTNGSHGSTDLDQFHLQFTRNKPFVVNIAGDGSFLFSVPSTVYFLAQNLRLPVLTVVLNNGGWQAPKNSAKSVNPDSVIQSVQNLNELKIGFGERNAQPRYAGIAREASAGWCGSAQVRKWEDVREVLERGRRWVEGKYAADEVADEWGRDEGRGFVVDCWVK